VKAFAAAGATQPKAWTDGCGRGWPAANRCEHTLLEGVTRCW